MAGDGRGGCCRWVAGGAEMENSWGSRSSFSGCKTSTGGIVTSVAGQVRNPQRRQPSIWHVTVPLCAPGRQPLGSGPAPPPAVGRWRHPALPQARSAVLRRRRGCGGPWMC